jgi:transposase
MLTRMTEEDWATVLEVFRACRSRRGAKGRNDRIFLEALHYFAVHNITWRALPEAFGHWNSVWKRFWRLSQAGVFEAFFDALAATSRTAHLVQLLDSTVVRAHVSAAGAKGGQDGQALGRSRGGFSTKIHLKADSRLTWMGAPSLFTSRKVRPATARNSRSCSTSDPTSRPARPWVTKAMMPRPIAQPPASAASAR